jgi:hypothetical protein
MQAYVYRIVNGYEGFDTAHWAGGSIQNAHGWNNWDANGRGHFIEESGKGHFHKDVALAWTTYPLLTFPTAQPSGGSGSIGFTLTIITNTNSEGYCVQLHSAGPASRILFYLYLATATTAHLFVVDNGALTDSGLDLTINVAYSIITSFVDTTHYTLTINGTIYGPWHTYLLRTGSLTEFSVQSAAAETITFDIDDIWTSWAQAAGMSNETLESQLNCERVEFLRQWNDGNIPAKLHCWLTASGNLIDDLVTNYEDHQVDLDNIKGLCVKIYQGANLAWKGYVGQVDTNIQDGDKDILLTAYDEFYKIAKYDISESNIIEQQVIDTGGVTLNEITLATAVKSTESVKNKWMMIRHNAGEVKYDDKPTASADTSACTLSHSTDAEITETGTHADTHDKDSVFHALHVVNGASSSEHAEASYTLDLATVANQTVISCKIKLEGHADWYSGLGFAKCEVWAWNYLLTTPAYEFIGFAGQEEVFQYGKPLKFDQKLKSDYITVNGANWEAKVRLMFATGSVNAYFYIDYLRVEITCSKDAGYVPIEARIDTVDSTTVMDINSIPEAVQNALEGDAVIISDSINDAVISTLAKLADVTVYTDDQFGGMPADERGNDGFTAFKNLCKRAGIDFWLDVQEDDSNSILHARSNKKFFDCANIASAVEIRNVGGWVRAVTRDKRVDIHRTNQVGSFLSFESARDAGGMLDYDTVYYLLSSALDTAPTRTFKSAEFYFSISGTAVIAGDYLQIYIYFPGENVSNAGPYIKLRYYLDGAVFKWKITMIDDTGGTSAEEIVEADDYNVIGIRVEFDYEAGTILLQKRDIIDVGATRVMSDSWVDIADCDDLALTEDEARAIVFQDNTLFNGVAASSYVNLHAMHVEFQPDTETGTITPGGDVILQEKESNVKSLMVIGGKDADDNELILGPVDIDTEGSDKVEVITSMKSLAELIRYVEAFSDKYESDKVAIRMEKYIDNDNIYHPGYTYTFTLDGTNYSELLRRAACTWDSKKNCCEWTLEFGKGQTFGREMLFRSGKRNNASINELKLK